jgi:hypothetical protein
MQNNRKTHLIKPILEKIFFLATLVSILFISVQGQPTINLFEKDDYIVFSNNTHYFILNDENAVEQVTKTNYYIDLSKEYPNVILFVDDKRSHYIYIYLGFNEGTHTTRKAFVRVSSDARVQYSEIPPAVESDWVNMQ